MLLKYVFSNKNQSKQVTMGRCHSRGKNFFEILLSHIVQCLLLLRSRPCALSLVFGIMDDRHSSLALLDGFPAQLFSSFIYSLLFNKARASFYDNSVWIDDFTS